MRAEPRGGGKPGSACADRAVPGERLAELPHLCTRPERPVVERNTETPWTVQGTSKRAGSQATAPQVVPPFCRRASGSAKGVLYILSLVDDHGRALACLALRTWQVF